MPLPVLDRPWARLALDLVGPLPRTKSGHRYLLTCMDFTSRYPEAVPLRQVDAQTVMEAMLLIFGRFGLPEEILTDNGAVFTGKLATALYSALGVKHIRISPYHPQSLGGGTELSRPSSPEWQISPNGRKFCQWHSLLPGMLPMLQQG